MKEFGTFLFHLLFELFGNFCDSILIKAPFTAAAYEYRTENYGLDEIKASLPFICVFLLFFPCFSHCLIVVVRILFQFSLSCFFLFLFTFFVYLIIGGFIFLWVFLIFDVSIAIFGVHRNDHNY